MFASSTNRNSVHLRIKRENVNPRKAEATKPFFQRSPITRFSLLITIIASSLLSLLLLFGITVVAHSGGLSGEQTAAPQSDEQVEIQKLIKQLGEDNFKARDDAAHKLKEFGEKALEAVEKACDSKDAEVRRRAQEIAEEIKCACQDRLLRVLLDKIESAPPIDQLIDQMAFRKELDTPENWDRFYKLAESLTQIASILGGKQWKLPELSYKEFASVSEQPGLRPYHQKFRVDGIPKPVRAIDRCLVVCGGPIQRLMSLDHSILFVNGDLQRGGHIKGSFVFCNGNIGLLGSIKNSIILATGDFAGSSIAESAFFQAKSMGRKAMVIARQNVFLNVEPMHVGRGEKNQMLKSNKGPLRVVKLFNPVQMGVELSQAGDRVRIDKIHNGSAFSRASLRAGDIVITAGKEAIASSEELSKFLRRRCAGDEFTLEVRRGKVTLEATVKLKD